MRVHAPAAEHLCFVLYQLFACLFTYERIIEDLYVLHHNYTTPKSLPRLATIASTKIDLINRASFPGYIPILPTVPPTS